jgi:dihydrolipoamide dehydrogenase
MPESIQTDLVVLGGGPGGYAAAFLAADRGMQTTLIDAAPKPGGTCLHIGCIPSKTLLHVAGVIHQAHDAADFGLKFAKPEIDLAKLRAKGDKIIDLNASHLLDLCKRRGVTHISARGVFTDANTIQVEKGPTVHFKNAIIATGSLPVRPAAFFDLGSPRILDSTAALALADVPKSLLVVGGGYIGLELGTVYAALGSQVTVVEMMGSLLPGVDADLVQPLAGRLKNKFKAIYLNTKVAKVEEAKGGIRAVFEGQAPEKDAVFDKVLVAIGRRPNSANLGLDKAGVETDARGFIEVNEQRRTAAAHIFAIGDVAGEPMLAHKASHEGKLAVQVLTGEPAVWEPRAIPAVVFTDPEIAWCGLTTTEAEQQDREVKVGKFRWASSGRAATLGRSDGLTKIMTDPRTDRILGVGLVGPGAGELISEGVVAIEMGATARDLALCIHPHPTLTETISEAAEMLHGLSSHIYVQRKKVL